MLDFGLIPGQGDQVGQRRLRFEILSGGVRLVFFDIDVDRCARGAGAGQAVDDARAVREQDANALPRPQPIVDRVVIGEIIGRFDFQRAKALAGQGGRVFRARRWTSALAPSLATSS